MPPATMTFASPARMAAAPSITAFRPEPQTLLTVVALTPSGSPPFSAAWRAGACPAPAWMTWPMIASSTDAGSIAGPLDGGADGGRPELGRRRAGKATAELPDRGAGRGEDEDVTHAPILGQWRACLTYTDIGI